METVLEIYDYIEKNKITDISDVLEYALHGSSVVKYTWVLILENDKVVDLLNCKIRVQNSNYNKAIIKAYYESSCVLI